MTAVSYISDAEREGTAALAASADTETQTAVAALVASGAYRWEYDPEVPGVLGVVAPGTNRAAVVVYAPGRDGFRDFEVDHDRLYPPTHVEVDGVVVASTRHVNL